MLNIQTEYGNYGDIKTLYKDMIYFNDSTVLIDNVSYCCAPAFDHGFLFDLSDVELWMKYGLVFCLAFENSLESALNTIRDSVEFVLERRY